MHNYSFTIVTIDFLYVPLNLEIKYSYDDSQFQMVHVLIVLNQGYILVYWT